MKVLVTGCAGFIGSHFCKRLLAEGHNVIGLDSLNDYYSVQLKKDRLSLFSDNTNFSFLHEDVANRDAIKKLYLKNDFDAVVHLAAQAGVRYSLENPHAYVDSNLVGFMNIIEGCRHQQTPHLVYASSSSVYGSNKKLPFSVEDSVDHPISLYAATKKANELMAHSYSHLYNMPTTGLRFFTVYGPWGRPDMALFKFVKAILANEKLPVFNEGKMIRDFTYVDDIVEGVYRVMMKAPSKDLDWHKNPKTSTSAAPYRVLNIGNSKPVMLMDFIEAIGKATNLTPKCDFLPMQPGDVAATHADVQELEDDYGFKPQTSVEDGINRFVEWYRSYFKK
jgi:UDP-glucuronate 4-epimerase